MTNKISTRPNKAIMSGPVDREECVYMAKLAEQVRFAPTGPIQCHTPCEGLTLGGMRRRRSGTMRWCVPGAGRELCPVGRWRISRSFLAPSRRLLSHTPPVDPLGELAGVPQVTSMKQVGAMVGDQELSVSP